MSVDDRLRTAFGQTDRVDDVNLALDAVLATSRRRTTQHRVYAAGGIAAAALVAAGWVVTTGDDSQTPAPAPQPTVSQSPTSSEPRTVLDGTWRTAPVAAADIRRTLRAAGLEEYADEVLAELPGPRVVFSLRFIGGVLDLTVSRPGQPGTDVLDQERFAVEGTRVTFTPRFAEGTTSYRFAVAGDALLLTFLSTSESDQEGVPGEAFQRAFYTTAEFVRR